MKLSLRSVGFLLAATWAPAWGAEPEMRLVAAGAYVPFASEGRATETVPAFRLDALPVTNGAYRAFLVQHPRWRRSNVKPVFADQTYLAHWAGDLDPGPRAPLEAPVVNVSWFAATAYCKAHGKRLPTTAQWEYALYDQGREADSLRRRLAAWHGEPNPAILPPASAAHRNGYGIGGLGDLVWEWTLDFHQVILGAKPNDSATCGGAGPDTDTQDYFRYLRYAYRAGLAANFTVGNLGFRCAAD